MLSHNTKSTILAIRECLVSKKTHNKKIHVAMSSSVSTSTTCHDIIDVKGACYGAQIYFPLYMSHNVLYWGQRVNISSLTKFHGAIGAKIRRKYFEIRYITLTFESLCFSMKFKNKTLTFVFFHNTEPIVAKSNTI